MPDWTLQHPRSAAPGRPGAKAEPEEEKDIKMDSGDVNFGYSSSMKHDVLMLIDDLKQGLAAESDGSKPPVHVADSLLTPYWADVNPIKAPANNFGLVSSQA
jgi:hypothetical protein